MKKKNKNGVILVTVLFIFAMAMILIAAAVMLTTNVRNRLYTRAEESQARLTVTSVAESFQAAIETHEINKTMVNALVDYGPIMIKADGMPGMAGTSDDYTTITVTKDNLTGQYKVDFVTVIDTQSDKLRLILKPVQEEDFSSPSFSHQVEVQGGGQLSNVKIGYKVGSNQRYEAKDNTILSRGGAGTPIGSTYMYSTFITTGKFTPASGSEFYSDVILWGANAGVNVGGINGNAFGVVGDYGIYFINNNDPITGYNGGSSFAQNTGSNIIVSNTNVNFNSHFGSAYQALGNGKSKLFTANGAASGYSTQAITSATEAIQNNLNTYKANGFVSDQLTSGEVWQWEQCASKNGFDVNVAGGTAYNIATSGNATLNPGTYKIQGTLQGKTITCDLSKGDYIFYCPTGLTIQNNGMFEFLNGGSHQAIFIIGKGKRLEIKSDNMAGIVDAKVYGATEDQSLADRKTRYSNNREAPNQSIAPSIYVYGAGMGTSHAAQVYMNGNQGSYLNAYVALYPSTNTSNDGGSFYFYNSTGKYYYGRINAYTVLSECGGHVNIPYCPAPKGQEDMDAFYPIKPDYEVVSAMYYY